MPNTTLGGPADGWISMGSAPKDGTLTITATSTAAFVYIRHGPSGALPEQMPGTWKILPGIFPPLPLAIPIVRGDAYAAASTGPTVVTWSFA